MRILFLLSIQRIFESDAQQHTHILHLRAIIWCSCELSSGDFKGRPSIRHDEPLLHATTAYEMNEKFKQCINYPNECIRFSLHGIMLFQLVFWMKFHCNTTDFYAILNKFSAIMDILSLSILTSCIEQLEDFWIHFMFSVKFLTAS